MIDNEIQEIWKYVVGYEGYYQVSNLGNVKSCERVIKNNIGVTNILKSKYLSLCNDKDGYKLCLLSKEGKHNTVRIHRIVANAFINNVDNKSQVNHINGIKSDNRTSNLEWATPSENVKHSYLTGLKKPKYRSILVFNKLSNEYVCDFYSISKASLELNIVRKDIYNVLDNKRKSAKGYYFKYKY